MNGENLFGRRGTFIVSCLSGLPYYMALQFYQRFVVVQLGGLIFFKHVICNNQIITCKEPDSFIFTRF